MPAPKDVVDLITDLRRDIDELKRNQGRLTGSGMSVPAPSVTQVDGNFVVEGSMQGSGFDGDLDAGDVGTTGWAFNALRAALPELLLRPGSLGNDILANPIQVGATTGGAQGFAVTTTWTQRTSQPMTVPAGFSQALVFCFASATALNSTAAADYFSVQAAINGDTGGQSISFTQPSTLAPSVVSIKASQLTGLAGGDVVTAEGWVQANGGTWAANALNTVQVNAFALWLR